MLNACSIVATYPSPFVAHERAAMRRYEPLHGARPCSITSRHAMEVICDVMNPEVYDGHMTCN